MTVIAYLFWTAAFLGAAVALVSTLRRDARDRDVPSAHHPVQPTQPTQHRTGSSS